MSDTIRVITGESPIEGLQQYIPSPCNPMILVITGESPIEGLQQMEMMDQLGVSYRHNR